MPWRHLSNNLIRAQGPASCSHSTPARTAGHATDSDGTIFEGQTSDYFLASRIRLNGVSVARRNRVKPASANTCFAPRRYRRRHRPARPPAAPRARPHVRPAQLAHPPPRRARHLRSVMTSMTRRAPPHSATISEVGAIVVSPENATCSLRSERATTHPLERPPLWPVLRRPRLAGFEVSAGGFIGSLHPPARESTAGL